MRKNLPAHKPNTPKSHLDAVIRFIKDRDIQLTPEQELYMQRISYADKLIRERKHNRTQIINSIAQRFDVSNWRADEDITDAHKAFGTTRKINKAYLLTYHLDDIQEQIALAKQARRLDLLPKLNQNYTQAIDALPEEEKESQASPTKIIFIIKDQAAKSVDVEALLAEARTLITTTNPDEYIDFEEQ